MSTTLESTTVESTTVESTTASPPSAGSVAGTPSDPEQPGRRPSWLGSSRRWVALALTVVLLAAAGMLAWQLARADGASTDLEHAESRERVMSVTDQFVKRLGTYSPELLDDAGQMPRYREQVREVITPKFSADFDEQVAAAEQLVAQGGVARSTQVFATGVSTIDDDSARVLVAGSFSDSYTRGDGKKARTIEQEPYPFRFVVDLVSVDGEWLVDDFAQAGAEPGQAQQPRPTTGGKP